MARNNNSNYENASFSNWNPNVIRAYTTRAELRRFGKEDNVLSLSVSVPQKLYGSEDKSFTFLELRFFNERADAVEANFGEDGPFGGGGVPVNITPGPLFIETYRGRLGSKNNPVTVEIDGEEYSSDEVEIIGDRIRYQMNPVDISIAADVNIFADSAAFDSIFAQQSDDDDDEEEDTGGRRGRSSSRRSKRKSSSSRASSRRGRRDDEDEDEDDDDIIDDDIDDEDEDVEDSDDVDDSDDEDEEEDSSRRPRSRSSRRGRSSRRASSRRAR